MNGARFHLLAGSDELGALVGGLAWHAQGCLALAPKQGPTWPTSAVPSAPGAAWARDRFGQHARIAETADEPASPVDPLTDVVAGRTILHDADGSWRALTLVDDAVEHALRPPSGTFVDLSLGGPTGEERLAALWRDGATHGVVLLHLRTRWTCSVTLPATAARIVVDGGARVWAAGDDGVVRIEGEPLPLPYRPQTARFEPERIVPNPPHVAWPPSGSLPVPGLGDGVRGLAVDGETLHLLGGAAAQPVLFTRLLDAGPDDPWSTFDVAAPGAPLPFSDLAVLAPGRVALLADFDPTPDPAWRRRDCPVLVLRNGGASAAPERHPFVERPAPRFVVASDGAVRWRGAGGTIRLLEPLALSRFEQQGEGRLPAPLDSALPGCVWHKIVFEARIPSTTSVVVDVRAADSVDEFAALDAMADEKDRGWERQPAPKWSPLATELPWADGSVAQRPGEAGLFELLIQRAAGRVRRVVGRHLDLRLRFTGDGRSTPAVRRMRVHFPRFSYQEQYLPRHFRQAERPADDVGRANGADFRERLLALVEGMFTPIEDRVAAAEMLVDPASCPEQLLEGLAAILGHDLDASLPLDVRRRLVAGIGEVAQWRGTLRGVRAALDLVTDDAASAGRVVVVENYRLRRTMATLLGVDVDDAQNPLTLGTMRSGNSIVGDSLILSAESARAFLAAIDPSLGGADDETAVKAFFDRWAHQVTVLLHGDAKALRATVDRVLAREMPAHVQWLVVESDHPFVLGLSPLLGVDTALELEPPPVPVVLDRTRLSREGLLTDAAAISPQQVHAADRT